MKTLYALMLACCLASASKSQEITGPDEVGVNQPALLLLSELPEGSKGKFDDGIRGVTLNTDPVYFAPGAAMFFASVAGEYRIVAAVVSDSLDISFVEKLIVVKADGAPPTPSKAITRENVQEWLEQVPLLARMETIVHPATGENMTRQQAVARSFENIGTAASVIKSVAGMDLMLSTALVPALGESAGKWTPLMEAIDTGLAELKNKDASSADYAKAFLLISEALGND
jgi:hypothetical protein